MFDRMFLALWPDDAGRKALARHIESWTWPEAGDRYRPADWHVTLHFLGKVAAGRLAQLATGLRVPFDAFDLVLDQPERWPRGLAVLGASALPEQLADLHERLARTIALLGLPVEQRRYRPHVTLARHAAAALPPSHWAPVVWPVRGYTLVLSTGRPEERYRVIESYGGQG